METPTSDARRRCDDLITEATGLHRGGQLAEAAQSCERVLAAEPGHAPALHLLGLIAYGQGDARRAETLLVEAARHQPNVANFHCDLGVVLEGRGAFAEAIAAYDTALGLDASLAHVHHNRANALRAAGRLDEAAAGYRAAIDLDPERIGAWLGSGIVLMALGRPGEAVEAFDRVLRHDPRAAIAHANRGNALAALGRAVEALAAYDAALRIVPADAELHFLRANLLREYGTAEDAAAAYRAAIALRPNHGKAHNNLAIVLQSLGRLKQALAALDRALEIDPDHAAAHANRGNVLMDQGQFAEAAAAFEVALRLAPGLGVIQSNYLNCLNYDPTRSEDEVHAAHLRWGRAHDDPAARARAHANDRDPDRTLRVGFVSADLGRHPVGYLLQPLMDAADPAQVALYCYSERSVEDELSRELQARAAAWRRTAALADAELAATIESDGIDVLVDLGGHTAGNRLACLARKPAPIQVHWLGYATTTGLAAMDYALWDWACVPAEAERWFSETVTRLPVRWCYAPPAYAPAVQVPPPGRGVTFGSFNNLTKLTPEVVETWSRILAAVPGARLMLSWMSLADAEERARIADLFAGHGIAATRLVLVGGAPTHAGVLALYHGVDVALDPFPYSGGLTTLEAVWMGAPVITLPGARPVSRQSAGLLAALGRSEWIARDRDHYLRLAVRLAADPTGRAAERAGQRRRMAASPLCDGPGFARAFEAALRRMWRAWVAGETPEQTTGECFT